MLGGRRAQKADRYQIPLATARGKIKQVILEFARQSKQVSLCFARDYGLQTEEPRQGRNAATVLRFALP